MLDGATRRRRPSSRQSCERTRNSQQEGGPVVHVTVHKGDRSFRARDAQYEGWQRSQRLCTSVQSVAVPSSFSKLLPGRPGVTQAFNPQPIGFCH